MALDPIFRWDADARLPNEEEFRQTLILAIPLDEASAKIRTGPPKDDEVDLDLPVWAGTLPLHLTPGTPEPDPALADGIEVPGYLTDYRRPST
jgi:hypothetical protein